MSFDRAFNWIEKRFGFWVAYTLAIIVVVGTILTIIGVTLLALYLTHTPIPYPTSPEGG